MRSCVFRSSRAPRSVPRMWDFQQIVRPIRTHGSGHRRWRQSIGASMMLNCSVTSAGRSKGYGAKDITIRVARMLRSTTRTRPALARVVPRRYAARVTASTAGSDAGARAPAMNPAIPLLWAFLGVITLKPRPNQLEFSVTPVFRVRTVDPLNAATARKWWGYPALRKQRG
ncbi:MAG: hypothetical protein ACI87W_001157 [Halieaceae bacterium]|jgi:hypothetical protein